ncbi:hypothetical protein ACFL2V_04385 [Pseudomonadota bacterium]
MMTFFRHFGHDEKNLFEEARLVYRGEAKEKRKGKAEKAKDAKPEETFETRQKEAAQEVTHIFGDEKYAQYELHKLPPEFRSHLMGSFSEWIIANVDNYDRDRDSDIDAAEFEVFKRELNTKVRGILDRLVGEKEQVKQEAVQQKESAEAAKARQERLKYQDVRRIDPGNLVPPETLAVADPVRGLVTELMKYQEDWKQEAQQFQMFATGDFMQVTEKIDKANNVGQRRGLDAIAAASRAVQPWLEDSREVKTAKAAREKAIADMQKRIEQLKKRQKDRQERGKRLNQAPEGYKKGRKALYEDAREQVRKRQEEIAEAKRKNVERKAKAEKAKKELEGKREQAQAGYDKLVHRTHQFEVNAQIATAEARKLAEDARRGGEGSKDTSPEELARRAQEAIDPQLLLLRRKVAIRHKHMLQLMEEQGNVESEISLCSVAAVRFDGLITKLGEGLTKLDQAETAELGVIDKVDEGIAETVLQVGVGNQELVKQAGFYLKQLMEMQVNGPGIIDGIGAGILGIPGVEKAWSWAGDTAAREWNFIKKDAVMGPVVEVLGYMGEGWVKAWDGIGSGFVWVGETLKLPEAWEWMSHASEHMSIGTPLTSRLGWLFQSNLPPWFKTTVHNLAAVGESLADTVTGGGIGTLIEVFGGLTEGAKDLVQGLGQVAQNPGQAFKGLVSMLNHPSMLLNAMILRDRWGHESSGKLIGRGIMEVWLVLTGTSAVAKGLAKAKHARNIEKLSRTRAAFAGIQEGAAIWGQEWQQLLAVLLRDIPVTIVRAPGNVLRTIAGGGKKSSLVKPAAVVAAKSMAPPPPSARGKSQSTPPPPPSSRRLSPSEKVRLKRAEEAAAKPRIVDDIADADTIPAGPTAIGMRSVQRVEAVISETEKIRPLKRTPRRAKIIRELEDYIIGSSVALANNLAATVRKLGGPNEFARRLDALPDSEMEMLLASVADLDAVLFERVLLRQFDEFPTIDGKKVRFYSGTHINSGGFGTVDEVAFHFPGDTQLRRGAIKRVRSNQELREQITSMTEMNFHLQSRDRIFHNEKLAAQAVQRFDDSSGLLRPLAISEVGSTHILIYEHIVPSFAGVGNDARLVTRVKAGETASNSLGFLDESLAGLERIHENGYIYLDFKADQVFVGRRLGEAGKAPDRAILGDLSLIHWTEIAELELRAAGQGRFAVLKRKKGQSVAESTQMGITPDYFSGPHLQKLIDRTKEIIADLEARGIDPSTVKRCPLSPNVLSVADKNQIGVTLSKMAGELLKRDKVPHTMAAQFRSRISRLVKRLKDPDDPITMPEARRELSEIRRDLDSPGMTEFDLPVIQA